MADQRQIEENYLPLRVPRTVVERHWGVIEKHLSKILPASGGKYFVESAALGGALADLRCGDFPGESARRQRGLSVPVVPLLEGESAGVNYWLSFHQEWREDLSPGSKKLVYHTTGLTVFFGDGTNEKLQLFRAEW